MAPVERSTLGPGALLLLLIGGEGGEEALPPHRGSLGLDLRFVRPKASGALERAPAHPGQVPRGTYRSPWLPSSPATVSQAWACAARTSDRASAARCRGWSALAGQRGPSVGGCPPGRSAALPAVGSRVTSRPRSTRAGGA